MSGFSLIDHTRAQMERQVEERKLLQPAEAWPKEQRTAAKRNARVKAAREDFWVFRQTYFTPEMYGTGYAEPCSMHYEIVEHSQQPGVHVELGPRDHGKTVTGLTVAVWCLLTGRRNVIATYSHTVFPTASNLLTNITSIIDDNPRIMEDFGIEWIEKNKEQAQFRVKGEARSRVIGAFSEGKSVRGFNKNFSRPEMILADDVETLSSPLDEEHTQKRVERVSEAYLSLTADGVFMWFGNNFDASCATNRLLLKQKAGELAAHWRVHVYDAWNDEENCPLWPERFPAETVEELREMLRPKDDADWKGNFRQRPAKREGSIFPEVYYTEYKKIPSDARGIAYCDPNLSLKEAGDTTAMLALLFSPSEQKYYVRDPHCVSYSDSNDLVRDYLKVKKPDIYRMGFDGYVNQEATWTNHFRNYSRLTGTPIWIEWRKYPVDVIAKNAEGAWKKRLILFPPGFNKTTVGELFMAQVHSFKGKKANKKDDAPDCLVCAFELLHETGLVRLPTDGNKQVHVSTESSMF